MLLLQSRDTGLYGLANRDFSAHNVLVDDDPNIIGLIDFDGVIASPVELVAQMSLFTGLERPIPGFVETGEFASKRIEDQASVPAVCRVYTWRNRRHRGGC